MKKFYLESYDRKEKWELEEQESMYLYACFFRFSHKFNISFIENEVLVTGELLCHLYSCIDKSLEILINDLYVKPDEKSIGKHPTRFERFMFNKVKHTVNYTTSISGRLMYLLYLRLIFLQEKIEKKESIILGFK